jgi:hypothetical protein
LCLSDRYHFFIWSINFIFQIRCLLPWILTIVALFSRPRAQPLQNIRLIFVAVYNLQLFFWIRFGFQVILMYNFSYSIQYLYSYNILYKDKVLYLRHLSVLLYLERDVVFVKLARILPAVPSIYPCTRQQKLVKFVLPVSHLCFVLNSVIWTVATSNDRSFARSGFSSLLSPDIETTASKVLVITCQPAFFVQGTTVCKNISIVSMIWNNPTVQHSYIHLAVSLHFRDKQSLKAVFHWAEFSARSRIFLCFVELIRKDKEKFRSARKIPPTGNLPIFSKLRMLPWSLGGEAALFLR